MLANRNRNCSVDRWACALELSASARKKCRYNTYTANDTNTLSGHTRTRGKQTKSKQTKQKDPLEK